MTEHNNVTISRELLRQAVEALASAYISSTVITALRTALEQNPENNRMVYHPNEEGWEHLLQYGYAPGNYTNHCNACGIMSYNVDKRAYICRNCAQIRFDKVNQK